MKHEKKCYICKEVKTLSQFCKSERSTDGRLPWCEECAIEYERRWREQSGVSCYQLHGSKTRSVGEINSKVELRWQELDGEYMFCKSCFKAKPLEAFRKSEFWPDKHHIWCKECSDFFTNHYRSGRANIPEWQKRYVGATQEELDAFIQDYFDGRTQDYIFERPKDPAQLDKDDARSVVAGAVKEGLIPRIGTRVCRDCGTPADHHHHESYSRAHWLDVTPLCIPCHAQRHKEMKRIDDAMYTEQVADRLTHYLARSAEELDAFLRDWCERHEVTHKFETYFSNEEKLDAFIQTWGKDREFALIVAKSKQYRGELDAFLQDWWEEREQRMRSTANGAVFYAVFAGMLPHASTRTCEDCDEQAEVYHHKSYERDRWLDVTPLCWSCYTTVSNA